MEKSEDKQASVQRVICLSAWFDSSQLILFCILIILLSLFPPIFFKTTLIHFLPLLPQFLSLHIHQFLFTSPLRFLSYSLPLWIFPSQWPFFIFLLKIRSSFHRCSLHPLEKNPTRICSISCCTKPNISFIQETSLRAPAVLLETGQQYYSTGN